MAILSRVGPLPISLNQKAPRCRTAHTIVPGQPGYQAEMIIANKESTYEIGLATESNGMPNGLFIGAFSGCWRWWGGSAVAGTGVWTHVAGGVDGANELHYVNGVPDGSDSCGGDLAKNDYPFKLGARSRGTGMSTQNDQSATVLTDNGSRFFGELDEVMVFSIGLDAAQAAGACHHPECSAPSFALTFRHCARSRVQSLLRVEGSMKPRCKARVKKQVP